MADIKVRNEFIEGMQEVYTALFNEGIEDGMNLYLLNENTSTNVYGEQKYKSFYPPKLLVCHPKLSPTQGQQDVEGIKNSATFTVPLKTLLINELGVSHEDLAEYRKGMIEFHGVYYLINNVTPRTYVEDCFLFYDFECTEDRFNGYNSGEPVWAI